MKESQNERMLRLKKERLELSKVMAKEETSKVLISSSESSNSGELEVKSDVPIVKGDFSKDLLLAPPTKGVSRLENRTIEEVDLKVESDFVGYTAIKWYDVTVQQIHDMTKQLGMTRKAFLDIILEDKR